MTCIKAELLLASKNRVTGDVLFSFRLTYPRFILSEILTHRTLSRNTSSTRAVPTKKMSRLVIDDPVVPVYLGANKKGMVPGEELEGIKRFAAEMTIYLSRWAGILTAKILTKLGVHKGIAGRYLEPWTWVTMIVSCTEINNFLLLRNHPDAEPHLQNLARQIQEIVGYVRAEFDKGRVTDPLLQFLYPGEWHLPFVTPECNTYSLETKKQISAARCAHVSYTVVGTGEPLTPSRCLEVCHSLTHSNPIHGSALEHTAMALEEGGSGNFTGFYQYRKEFEK